MPRLDSRGRRIGRNWWREYVMGLLRDDTDHWLAQAEATALGYPTELAEYRAEHPMPQLRDYLIARKGTQRYQAS